MISKLSDTTPLGLRLWAQEVQSVFNNYIHVVQVPVSSLGTGNYMLHGKHVTNQLQVGETCYIEFIVPHSINEFKEVTIRFLGTVTGTFNYTVNLSYGPVGGDENASTKTITVNGATATDDQIREIDITSLFSDQDAGDQIGVELIANAFTTTTDIHVLDLYVKYI